MKKNLTKTMLALLLILGLKSISLAQEPKAKTVINLAPGITAPISYPNNVNPNRITPCDNGDVRISPSARPQSEIHLSINKQNPQVLLLSANTFPNFNSWQGAYWSTNGGLNWNGSDDLPNGAFGRGDPSTAFDANGNGYVATMNAADLFAGDANGYLMQRTNDNGTTWQPQVAGTGVLNNFDKEMIAADDVPTSPFVNNIYCSWSILVQNPANDLVQFNRSTNQGNNFGTPITLKTGWGQGTNVQTGPNGEVYVCWADYNNSTTDWTSKGLGFCRSIDGGINFTAAQRVITYTGIRTYNSATLNDQNPEFNMTRVNDFPSMAVDKSNGVHRGRIYVSLPVRENGNGRAIIQISFSDNQGTTWSTPSTVSIPNGRQNWFPWIAIDDTNGDIFVAYYSLDEATGFNTNTYVASSNDGGATFVNQRVSDMNHVNAPIAEFGNGYAGDYIGITAHSGRAFASWMDNRTGQWQIYVSQLRDIDIVGDNIVCGTSNNYALTNLPAGATVQWSATPQGYVTINSPNSPQTTITKLLNGTITLTATISNACVGQITVTKENIVIGIPQFKGWYNSPTNPIEPLRPWIRATMATNPTCFGTYITTTTEITPNATVVWSDAGNSGGVTWYQIGNNLRFYFSDIDQWAFFSVAITNSCGTTNLRYRFNSVGDNCSGGPLLRVIVSPNPSTSAVNVELVEGETVKTNKDIKQLRVIDKTGNVMKVFEFGNGNKKVNIDISSLPADVYNISVYDGNLWYTTKLLKN